MVEGVTLPLACAATCQASINVQRMAVEAEGEAPLRPRDAADALLVQLRGTAPMSFRALVAGIDDRIEVIVRFLAVLELYKQGMVELDQPERSRFVTVAKMLMVRNVPAVTADRSCSEK